MLKEWKNSRVDQTIKEKYSTRIILFIWLCLAIGASAQPLWCFSFYGPSGERRQGGKLFDPWSTVEIVKVNRPVLKISF
jgi:hypothetical protein